MFDWIVTRIDDFFSGSTRRAQIALLQQELQWVLAQKAELVQRFERDIAEMKAENLRLQATNAELVAANAELVAANQGLVLENQRLIEADNLRPRGPIPSVSVLSHRSRPPSPS